MNMLGQTVAHLRTANGWSMQDLAARVRQAGARNVQYQHIQQLEAKPSTSPRYVVELATAFGKTVEELREWKAGDPLFGPHHAVVRDGGPPPYMAAESFSPEEIDLLAAYRACQPDVRKAIRVLLLAARQPS